LELPQGEARTRTVPTQKHHHDNQLLAKHNSTNFSPLGVDSAAPKNIAFPQAMPNRITLKLCCSASPPIAVWLSDCSFGVPYLSITRHSHQDSHRLWARFGAKGGALSSRWQSEAHYDLYLPATGCVVHVGWVQRVYDRYGLANDVYASQMEHLVTKCLRQESWVTHAQPKWPS